MKIRVKREERLIHHQMKFLWFQLEKWIDLSSIWYSHRFQSRSILHRAFHTTLQCLNQRKLNYRENQTLPPRWYLNWLLCQDRIQSRRTVLPRTSTKTWFNAFSYELIIQFMKIYRCSYRYILNNYQHSLERRSKGHGVRRSRLKVSRCN